MKQQGQNYLFTWSVELKAAPNELWSFISDTNQIFRLLGAPSVKKTQLNRSAPKGFVEVTHTHLSSYSLWEQEPYFWEKPFRYGATQNYKVGILKQLKFHAELVPNGNGTELTVKIWLKPSKSKLFFFVKLFIERIVKRRFYKLMRQYDECATENKLRYEFNSHKKLVRGAEGRVRKLSKILEEETRRKRIIDHLVEYIRKADDEDLVRIHPFHLAEYWGEKKYSVLNVFLHAAKHNLLDFNWDVCCPKCKAPRSSFRKLKEGRISHYCEECDIDYDLNFNTNTHLVFTPHPLIRKISDRDYSFGHPNSTPHKVSQHFLTIGEQKYLDIELSEGTYLFKSHNHKGSLTLHVREDGLDTINLYLTDEHFDGQEVTISTHPNITLINASSKKQVCFIELKDWKKEATYASEVSSAHHFRSLFPKETLKEGTTVRASGVTMLFTDIMNSTELYREEGDEFAIGRVMSHFKIIQQIIAEERGGIVKTIGDSVMAIFREPVSALKAVERIQQIFTGSTGLGESFRIKAGIHFGDCTAVNLNDRIDYFGTTVNIAARLVDVAKEKEIIISESVFNHPDVQLYLKKKSDILFVKESQIALKGFKNEEFRVKQIRLERPSLRLVV